MDWLDAYLDNLADGRNVVYPPDKNTWTPIKPNIQQQSMIQDAVAFDQQCQMRMIQEARADLEAHGMSQEDVEAGIGADPGSPTVQSAATPPVVYPEWNGGASYNVGDIVALNGTNYECTATAGAGFGPFGGFLDGTENGTVYWSAYPIINSFAYRSYPPGGLVDDNNGNIPVGWVQQSDVVSVIFAQDNSVTSIDSNAFYECQLAAVTIPSSVTSIGNYAFTSNLLTALTIPNGVTSIGSSAFQNNAIATLSIGTGVTSIGSYAFSNNAIATLSIGTGVTSIGNNAFASNQLTSVTIPNNVTSIGDDAFYGNPIALMNIDMTNIPDGLFYSDSFAFSLTMGPNVRTIGNTAFMFNSLTTVTIPNGVTSIGSSAFMYNSLASVSIGTGVTSIGSYAFKYNASLASVSCFAPATAFVGSQAFSYTASPLTIRVPATGAVSDTWTDGGPQTFQGNDNVTVIKDL